MVGETKVAFFHDNFAQYGGAERVAEEIAKMLPQADVLSTVTVPRKLSAYIRSRQVKTTWMQHLPAIDRLYRHYFLLYPLAVRSLDFSPYDVVISSCVGFAKGAIRDQGALHICYCHTPTRWIWRFNDYAERESFSFFKHFLLRSLITVVRKVDIYTASQPDYYIANSQNVADRIKRYYKRKAFVIHPPVDLSRFRVSNSIDDYLLIVSRLLPYKRIDLAIEACNRLGKRLLIIGDGPDRARLGALAGPTVRLLGWRSDEEVADLFSRCQAVVFPGEEDFGMVPVEANASGRPVIALAAGGALETVIDGVTGVLYQESSISSLEEAIRRCEQIPWDAGELRKYSRQFDVSVFRARFLEFLSDVAGSQVVGSKISADAAA
jgi:glycosyltransferase involved in cell wall biosynthesis